MRGPPHSVSGLSLRPADGAPPYGGRGPGGRRDKAGEAEHLAGGGPETGGAKQGKQGAVNNPKDVRMYNWVFG